MSDKSAEQQVLDGSIWEEFCDTLKEAGKLVDAEKAPRMRSIGPRVTAT